MRTSAEEKAGTEASSACVARRRVQVHAAAATARAPALRMMRVSTSGGSDARLNASSVSASAVGAAMTLVVDSGGRS